MLPCWSIFLLLFVASSAFSAEPLKPTDRKIVSPALVLDQLQEVSKLGSLLSSDATGLIVDTTQLSDNKLIGARKIVFRSGSKLVLSTKSAEPVTIVAEEIIVEGGATVTWNSIGSVESVPPPRGKAPDGSPGRADGANGGSGLEGESGNPGYRGQSAPSINIYATRLVGGELTIDVRGQGGGKGGRGQDGGDGGAGAKGAPASSSMFDCRRGPGKGGDGGKAGNAGRGGTGGAGGNGGNVTVFTPDGDAKGIITVFAIGGAPGEGGEPGQPGKPGIAGLEGEKALPFCKPEDRNGNPGEPGKSAEPGEQGLPGADGLFSVVPVSPSQAKVVFSKTPWRLK
jgi:hypothetical protein